MNRSLLLILILLGGCLTQEKNPPVLDAAEAEEYIIYTVLLEKWSFAWVVVIEDHTRCDAYFREKPSERLQWVKEGMPELEQETLDDFFSKNEQSHPLGNFFSVKARIVLLSQEEHKEIFERKGRWIEFCLRYPFSDGTYTLDSTVR